ncbi:MAG: TIGR00730 family Rossman fold protein, partial [Cyclobacteriaceae bacterium]|nr:TIGR00730 family Rossman fold protein [Cyclobacteriaceae bacterium]
MNICVFCGSASGNNPAYADAAKELASLLCTAKSTLIYGGGNIGLMGILADEVMRGGGKVIGVIPDFLMNKEVGHAGISKLEVVGSMHERKRRMADLADAFIALPGGWGT